MNKKETADYIFKQAKYYAKKYAVDEGDLISDCYLKIADLEVINKKLVQMALRYCAIDIKRKQLRDKIFYEKMKYFC